ncbi:carbohydrate ABC transporter permease [Kitasatospora azatica]|uniref:carbohydrate ABC transporter permease n=1 Tax=Kitasatospora azatica TaxID=58347 RepID=UPI000A053F0E|nr:sugar ABC transporter permease [Kitasatospora azatica]
MATETSAPPLVRAGGLSAGADRRISRHRLRERLGTQAFLIPITVVLALFFLVPLAESVYWSFTDYSGFSQSSHLVGLRNYREIFTDSEVLTGLGFTLLYAVATTVIVTVIAIPLATVLNRRFPGRNAVRAAFFFPAVPSMALLGLVWTFVLSPLSSGVINSVLGDVFGVGPVPWLSDNTLAKVSVVTVGVWAQAGWHAVLYLAYLQSVPRDYYEAATIDGATPRQQFFRITLPLLAPAMTVSQFLLLINGLRVYDLPFTLTKGGPGYATTTFTQVLIQRGVSGGDYGLGAALGVVFLVAVAIVLFLQLSVTRRLERRFR